MQEGDNIFLENTESPAKYGRLDRPAKTFECEKGATMSSIQQFFSLFMQCDVYVYLM